MHQRKARVCGTRCPLLCATVMLTVMFCTPLHAFRKCFGGPKSFTPPPAILRYKRGASHGPLRGAAGWKGLKSQWGCGRIRVANCHRQSLMSAGRGGGQSLGPGTQVATPRFRPALMFTKNCTVVITIAWCVKYIYWILIALFSGGSFSFFCPKGKFLSSGAAFFSTKKKLDRAQGRAGVPVPVCRPPLSAGVDDH